MKIGVLALQGGFACHQKLLATMGVAERPVTQCKHLQGLDALIIPGGESSCLLNLMQQEGLFDALKSGDYAALPILGTCAGAILLAETVQKPSQASLAKLPISVERNAYGRQRESSVLQGLWHPSQQAMDFTLIRAPKITAHAASVQVLASCDGQPLALRAGRYVAATYHAELTGSSELHRYFLDHCLA